MALSIFQRCASMHWKCLKSRTINSALNEDAKNVCGALNICTKSLRIVKSHASALLFYRFLLRALRTLSTNLTLCECNRNRIRISRPIMITLKLFTLPLFTHFHVLQHKSNFFSTINLFFYFFELSLPIQTLKPISSIR